MKRKIVISAGVLLIVALGLWIAMQEHERETARRASYARPGASRQASTVGRPAQLDGTRLQLDVERDGQLQLEGQVIDVDGQPVASAEVTIDLVPPRTTRTEDDGTFVFEKLIARPYVVTARSAGRAGGPVAVHLTARSEPAVIRLGEGATLVVTVTDEATQAIPGAVVSIRGDSPAGPFHTDTRGITRITPITQGVVSLDIEAPGYAPAIDLAMIGSPGITVALTVQLKRGIPVTGRVVDVHDRPIAHARVTAVDPEHGRYEPSSVMTDPQGRFSIGALPPGAYVLQALDGEHAPGTSRPFRITNTPVHDLVIVQAEGGVLWGSVMDAERRPVPLAYVSVQDPDGARLALDARHATTDTHGAFELRGLARGRLHVRADTVDATADLDVDLTTTPQLELTLVLDATGEISGIVVDQEGRPVPEAQIGAWPEDAPSPVLRGATSSGDGRFVLRGLPEGRHRLFAARRSLSAMGFDVGPRGTAASTGDRDVRVVLASPGALTGRVTVDGLSAPPQQVMLTLGTQLPIPAPGGVFVIKDIPPGSYDLALQSPDFVDHYVPAVTIEAGRTTDLGTITAAAGRRVIGRVVDASGAGVAGASVRMGRFRAPSATSDGQGFASLVPQRAATTNAAGEFTIRGVPPTSLLIMADHPAHGTSAASALSDGPDNPPPLTLTLRAATP